MAAEEEVKEIAGEGEGEAAPAGGKKKKLLMLISAGIAVVGIAVGGGVFFMLKGGSKHEEAAGPTTAYYDLPQMAVNLLGGSAEGGEEQHFLKLKLAFQLGKPEDAAAMDKVQPKVQDDYQAFLRQMRIDDMRGSAALARLKDALLLRVNQIMAPQKVVVQDVLFREVLVQ